jgi:hypothetical protein
MNKADLTVLLALAEVARKAGLINMDAFEVVGGAVRRATEMHGLMGERDQLAIVPAKDQTKPDEAAQPKKEVELSVVGKPAPKK